MAGYTLQGSCHRRQLYANYDGEPGHTKHTQPGRTGIAETTVVIHRTHGPVPNVPDDA